MRISLAQSVDNLAGPILCHLLKILPPRVSSGRSTVVTPEGPVENILIIKLFGLGSIIQMSPMINALREKYPDAEITLLTFTENRPVAAMLNAIDTIETIRFSGSIPAFLAAAVSKCLELRRRRFDLIFDCEFYAFFSAAVTHFCRTRGATTFGFFNNRPSKDWIFSNQVALDQSRHVSGQFMKLLMPLGIESPQNAPLENAVTVDADAKESLISHLDELGISRDAFICAININASELSFNRRWPPEYYKKLILGVLEHAGVMGKNIEILLIGGPSDVTYVSRFISQLGDVPVKNLAGRISLSELAALFDISSLVVTNDSGPLHLAAACGTPTMSLYGPETPEFYGPIGSDHVIFYADAHCSPCLNVMFGKRNYCSDNQCMKNIFPENVLPVVIEKIDQISVSTT